MGELDIDKLISAGYKQVSRKYRKLARPTAKEPNQFFSDDFIILTKKEFSIYQKKIGNTGWTPTDVKCDECLSLGHNHSKYCSKKK